MNFGGNNNYDALLSGLGPDGYSTNPVVAATGGFMQNRGTNQTVDLWDYSTPKTETTATGEQASATTTNSNQSTAASNAYIKNYLSGTSDYTDWLNGLSTDSSSIDDVIRSIDQVVASASSGNSGATSGVTTASSGSSGSANVTRENGIPQFGNVWDESSGQSYADWLHNRMNQGGGWRAGYGWLTDDEQATLDSGGWRAGYGWLTGDELEKLNNRSGLDWPSYEDVTGQKASSRNIGTNYIPGRGWV